MLRFSRSIKTLHTPTHFSDATVRTQLLSKIQILDEILNRTSYDRSVLYTPKYKRIPQLITSRDTVRMGTLIRDFVDNITMDQAYDITKQLDPNEKLGKVGLELFLGCNKNNITPLSTQLTTILMEGYNRYAQEEGFLNAMMKDINQVKTFLSENKFMIEDPRDIDTLVEKIAFIEKDAQTMKSVLHSLNHELKSDDIVRVVRGNTMDDHIELSKGWKFNGGISDTNEAYLRSIEIDKKKIVSINEPCLVLIYDGTLRDSDKILPTLYHAAKKEQSVILVVNGDVTGDALTSIVINNNKNSRKSNPSRTIILRYNDRDNEGVSLQENYDFIKFCKLPQQMGSIYSPKYSECVPSSASSKLFYGSMESIKATTGECFLYNPNSSHYQLDNKALRTTLTLHVGGQSEFEIDQRRASLDNIINNVLCHGLAEGFIPSFNISLAKAARHLSKLPRDETLMAATARNLILESLTAPMDQALKNKFGTNKFERAQFVANTMNIKAFHEAEMPDGSKDMISSGHVEPWNKVDQCLDNVMGFIKMITSCNAFVTRIFEKPKKT